MRNETSISIAAPPERVWSVMTDVERWHEWTASITSAKLLDGGGFAVGSKVRIKQPKVTAATWQVTRMEPDRCFEWENRSPGLYSRAGHEIEPEGEGCRVTLWVEQTGLLSPVFGLLYAGMTRRYIRLEAEGLKQLCEAGAS